MNIIEHLLSIAGYIKKPTPRPHNPRLCQKCGKQIKRGERWHRNPRPEHWDCADTRKGPERDMENIGQEKLPL